MTAMTWIMMWGSSCRFYRVGERIPLHDRVGVKTIDRRSIGASPAIAPGVGSGDPHAVLHHSDRLHGAGTFQMADALQPVAEAFELGEQLVAEIRVDGERAVTPMGPIRA